MLGRLVREQQLLDLPTAVHRMTQMPSDRFGFTDRGIIEPGRFADLVLLDTEPTSIPTGIVGVWVNGHRVVADGRATDARPGRVIRCS